MIPSFYFLEATGSSLDQDRKEVLAKVRIAAKWGESCS
jgi:hypothetical protein